MILNRLAASQPILVNKRVQAAASAPNKQSREALLIWLRGLGGVRRAESQKVPSLQLTFFLPMDEAQ